MNLATRYVELSRLGRAAFTEAVPAAVLVMTRKAGTDQPEGRNARGTTPHPDRGASEHNALPPSAAGTASHDASKVLTEPDLGLALAPTDKFRITAEELARPFGSLGSPRRDELLVFPLKKKKGTPFVDLITLGRTYNHDLVVSDGSVSRFHAFFRKRDEGWFICDAGSTNGTYLGDQKLDVRTEKLLRHGAELRVGSCEMRFHTPTSLYDFLRSWRS